MLFRSRSSGLEWAGTILGTREGIIEKDLDEDGRLVIEVGIAMTTSDYGWSFPRMEPEPTLVAMYNSVNELGDVTVVVDGESFKLDSRVIAIQAPALYEMTLKEEEDNDDNSNRDVLVLRDDDTSQTAFRAMIKFLYTRSLPTINDEKHAKLLLGTANRYGCVELKLYMESVIVERFLSPGSAASLMLFADANSCPQLKESAMDVCVSNMATVMETKGWKSVEESPALLNQFIRYHHVDRRAGTTATEYKTISSIRIELKKLGHPLADLDGTREMLLERLESH